MGPLAAAHDGLPDDLVNFHWDPITAAVAVGWPEVTVGDDPALEGESPVACWFRETADGRMMRVTAVDGPAFSEEFLAASSHSAEPKISAAGAGRPGEEPLHPVAAEVAQHVELHRLLEPSATTSRPRADAMATMAPTMAASWVLCVCGRRTPCRS